MADATEVIRLYVGGGLTIAVAESLTGGLVGAALTDVPGASEVFVGGVVAYATDAKHEVLGVPMAVLENHGAVSAETAAAMADRVREIFGTDIGISTTGVAGPDTQEGKPAGMVFIGVAGTEAAVVNEYAFEGSRDEVRNQTVSMALELLIEAHDQIDMDGRE